MEPDLAQIWSDICTRLVKNRVDKAVVDRWFSDCVINELNEETITVHVATRMHVLWVDTYYRGDLERAVSEVIGGSPRIMFEISAEGESDVLPVDDICSDESQQEFGGFRPEAPTGRPSAKPEPEGLNPNFTLESFVVGENSQYCHASAIAVATEPGKRYNPLLIFGGSGLGKTHLMTAIGHEALRRKPSSKVLFKTGEDFCNEFIEALQNGELAAFRNRYRKLDYLLLDDIHFLAGKDSTQEEFFHTFNALINSQSQIILTSDRAPGEIPRLEKRLVSRFQWGISAEILAPGVETRIAILRRKAHEWNVDIDSHVLEFVAKRVKKNVRRLEGALLRLSSYHSLYKNRITVEQAADYLRDILMDEMNSAAVSITDVQKAVATYFDVRLADLSGRRRTSQIVRPRHVAMYLSRELTDASLKDVGQAFGGRDHGTVINACKRVTDELDTRPETRRVIEFLQNQLTQG